MAKKFIITDTTFKMGVVSYHSELRDKQEPVLGGGRWLADQSKQTLYLWGASMDFGYAHPVEIEPRIKEAFGISLQYPGYTVMHSPLLSDHLPELDTFKELCKLAS